MDNDQDIVQMGFHALMEDTRKTPFQKYQDITIGKKNFFETLRYEILTTLLGHIPGIIGLYLRQKFYKFLLGKFGKGIVIGKGVCLRQPAGIFIGDKSILDDYSHISVRSIPTSRIIIGKNVLIGRYSTLKVRGGVIEVEDFADIGEFCRIGTTTKVRIGQYTMIAAFCYIGASNHKFDKKDLPIALQGVEKQGGVTIGNDVWIGTRVTIVDGVNIGKGAIIGAHSLVTSDIPPYAVAYGTPARIVRRR